MSEKLLALRNELELAISTILPQIEGLEDFARLNIKPETQTKVQEATADFKRRRDLLVRGLNGLDDLANDSYPATPQREVLGAVYTDLQENVSTISAAFAKFSPIEEATKAEITAGVPEPKQ